mmetsp:Transcript_11049/g.16275  ORF Transcript_11049/g.16275 Transcript_11049/m.16275 type:complete len:405 (-) Transcript_11049:504-1718(-)
MAKKVVVTPAPDRSLPGQQLECTDEVVDVRGGRQLRQYVVEGNACSILALGSLEPRPYCLLHGAGSVGGQGHGEEEEVVPRVEAVPEGRHGVGGGQAAVRARIHIPLQPALGALVPGARVLADVAAKLEAQDVHVGSTGPPNHLPFLVEALEAEASKDGGTFCQLPCKVVLEANHEEDEPAAQEELPIGLAALPFGIVQVGDGHLGGAHDVDGEAGDGDGQAAQAGQQAPRGAAPVGHALGAARRLALHRVRVVRVLKGWTGEDVGEVVGVAKVLEGGGQRVDGKVLASGQDLVVVLDLPGQGLHLLWIGAGVALQSLQLGRVGLGDFLLLCQPLLAVKQVEPEAGQLHGQHHLWPSEVQAPPHVVSVHPVEMSRTHVGQDKGESHNGHRLAMRPERHQQVGDR